MPRLRVSEFGVRASIALIVVVIGLVGYIQFTWFRQSAAVEIEGAYRSLNATVLQTMSREFERYAPIISDLKSGASGGGESPGALRARLQREYETYGPTGSMPRLIASVGITTLSRSSWTLELAPEGGWKEGTSPFATPIPENTQRMLGNGELIVCSAARGGREFILAPAGPTAVAVVELDVEGFFETYTKPAVASILPGADIRWTTDTRDDRRRAGGPRSLQPMPQRRSFNPIRAMFGAGSDKDRTFVIVVPATMDSFMMRGLGWFDTWKPGPTDGGSFRPLRVGEGPDPRAAVVMREAKVVVSARSAIGSMEGRLALNWLVSVFLLIGLALAFAQAISQKHKIRMVQRREREFVASVTHELRTPVTAIRSASDNMRRGLVGPERMATYGEMIYGQSLRLGSMIEEVLLFSQVEGKAQQPPVLSLFRVEDLSAEFRAPLEAIAKADGLCIEWDFGGMPKKFLCDADALRLILSNLVANALYHAYPGEPKGEVRVIGKSRLPESLQFSVEDDGRGIPKSEQSLVFEPFYRDEESRARHEKGSGLGLFIALRKARLLGGDLVLESPYERIDGLRRSGCRFTLTLPLKESDDAR